MTPKGLVCSTINILLLSTINVMAIQNVSIRGEITDIETTIELNENQDDLQLKLNWIDTLPEKTTYNVLVTAVNSTLCYEFPCSLYGISKPKNYILIPENPVSYTDVVECRYMFGCNYTLVVENSKASIFSQKNITIPYCVSGVCSCRHQRTLPKVDIVGTMSNNHTIYLKWSFEEAKENLESFKIQLLSIIINEQTNTALSWGGKNIPVIEKLYSLENNSSTTSSSLPKREQQQHGTFEIKITRDLAPGAILNIHSNVVDELNCFGPSNVIKLKVPLMESIPLSINNDVIMDSNVRIALIIITAMFSTAVFSIMGYCIWVRTRVKEARGGLHKNEDHLTTEIPMEKNINYLPFNEDMRRNNNFEVPANNIQIEAEIGEGAFGRVYRARAVNLKHMQEITIVAVKQLKKNSTPEEEKEFIDEIRMLQDVGIHINIVCFLGCCTLQRPYFMIMEYVGRGDLLSYLRTARYESITLNPQNVNYLHLGKQQQELEQEKPKLNYLELKMSSTQSVEDESEIPKRTLKPSLAETTYTVINDDLDGDGDDEKTQIKPFEYKLDHKELHDFALQIANGMRFLEEREITHRDLAARNVLIDDRKILKISDFGLSRHGIYINTKTRKLPLRWLSIEAICDNIYSNKSDVWAFGVVLWEIGTLGASPYPTISNQELVPFLLSGQRLYKPDICTDQVYELMLQCWNEDPDERSTFDEIYRILSPKSAYIDISTLSDDYVFPPIRDNE